MPHFNASTNGDDPAPNIPHGTAISSCFCFGVEFSEITGIATGCTDERHALAEAHRQTRCGSRCGLCLPYIQLAIKTNRTAFPVLWAEDFATFGIDPDKATQIQESLAQGTYAVTI